MVRQVQLKTSIFNFVDDEATIKKNTKSAKLEARRNKLRSLFKTEEAKYEQMLQQMAEEKKLQKQLLSSQLKQDKEAQRQKFAIAKLEQQLLDNDPELRNTISHLVSRQLADDQRQQIEHRKTIKVLEAQEEQFWAALNHEDRLAKALREQKETDEQKRRMSQAVSTWNQQLAYLDQTKLQREEMKKQEAQLLYEQKELMKLDMERARMAKRRAQEQMRIDLEECIHSKQEQTKREREQQRKQQLAYDRPLLAAGGAHRDRLLRQAIGDQLTEFDNQLHLKQQRHLLQTNSARSGSQMKVARLCEMQQVQLDPLIKQQYANDLAEQMAFQRRQTKSDVKIQREDATKEQLRLQNCSKVQQMIDKNLIPHLHPARRYLYHH